MGTYSAKFNLIEIEAYRRIFEGLGADFSTPQYIIFQARLKYGGAKGGNLTASFYESGKFVVQGNGVEEFCAEHLGITVPVQSNSVPGRSALMPPPYSAREAHEQEGNSLLGSSFASGLHPYGDVPFPHIGIDESGKGDFFGPLVIAGVYLDEAGAKKCTELGVCDSKKLTDKAILVLASKIKAVSVFDVVVIGNKKYNELYSKFKNLNKMLAWGHVTVLENLLGKKACNLAISDKFADESVILNALKEKGKKIKLIQKTKAEADLAVAAASILARAEFVNRLSRLSAQYGLELPKGASDKVIEQGKAFAAKYGKDELQNTSKLHFKTMQEI